MGEDMQHAVSYHKYLFSMNCQLLQINSQYFSPQNLFPRVGRSGGGVLGVPRLGQGQLLNRYSEAGTSSLSTVYLRR